MFDLAIEAGTMVDGVLGEHVASIGIQDGRIREVRAGAVSMSARRRIDARGLHVFPGLVEPHAHIGVYRDAADDFAYEGGFALLGGVTTVLTYFRTAAPYQESMPPYIAAGSAHGLVDFGVHLGILTRRHLAELPWLLEQGISSYKFFMGYRGVEKERYGSDQVLHDGFLVDIMERFRELSQPPLLAVHCENAELTIRYRDIDIPPSLPFLERFERSSPPIAEAEAIHKVAYLAQQIGVPIYIVHLSSALGLEVLQAIGNPPGQVTVETCPHYLVTNAHNEFGARAAVLPPLRYEADQEALWEAVRTGRIDTIGSDHCPCTADEKEDHGHLRPKAVGFGELGHTLPLLLEEGWRRRGLPLRRISELTSMIPAQKFGLFPRKGTLLPGADADLVAVDLQRTIRLPLPVTRHVDFSIYAGRETTGHPAFTVRGGQVVAEDMRLTGDIPPARFIARTLQAV